MGSMSTVTVPDEASSVRERRSPDLAWQRGSTDQNLHERSRRADIDACTAAPDEHYTSRCPPDGRRGYSTELFRRGRS